MGIKTGKVNYQKLLRSTSIGQRAALASTSSGQALLSSLTPTEIGSLFPDYYKRNDPDVSGFLKATARRYQGTTAPSSTASVAPSVAPQTKEKVVGGGGKFGGAGASGSFGSSQPSDILSRIEKTAGNKISLPQSGSLSENQKEAYKTARKEGLSDSAAKAMVANMMGESLKDPTNKKWDSKHFSQGIIQWDDNRSAKIKAQFGKFPMEMTVAEQTKAHIWELKNEYKDVWEALNNPNTTPSQMVDLLVRKYERPANPDSDVNKRIGYFSGIEKMTFEDDPALIPHSLPPGISPEIQTYYESLNPRQQAVFSKSIDDALKRDEFSGDIKKFNEKFNGGSTKQASALAVSKDDIIPPVGDHRFNRHAGQDPYEFQQGGNLTKISTPFGEATVAKDAAAAYKGFYSDLHEIGAPIQSIGSYNIRKKNSAGPGHSPGDGWSEHSFGNATDIDNSAQLSKKMKTWLEDPSNKAKFEKAKSDWGMKSPKGDDPHMEFGGNISNEARNRLLKMREQAPVSDINNALGSQKPVTDALEEAKKIRYQTTIDKSSQMNSALNEDGTMGPISKMMAKNNADFKKLPQKIQDEILAGKPVHQVFSDNYATLSDDQRKELDKNGIKIRPLPGPNAATNPGEIKSDINPPGAVITPKPETPAPEVKPKEEKSQEQVKQEPKQEPTPAPKIRDVTKQPYSDEAPVEASGGTIDGKNLTAFPIKKSLQTGHENTALVDTSKGKMLAAVNSSEGLEKTPEGHVKIKPTTRSNPEELTTTKREEHRPEPPPQQQPTQQIHVTHSAKKIYEEGSVSPTGYSSTAAFSRHNRRNLDWQDENHYNRGASAFNT